jgi:hypothetical protein
MVFFVTILNENETFLNKNSILYYKSKTNNLNLNTQSNGNK